jgi:argonaute-like protein implicated in RNA metabolism and viral defense
MQIPDAQLVYILNNIALASYAKLGGIPWLLQANRAIAHELIFGLGSASVGESRLGNRERIVGITTVFTGDGNYLLECRSKAATIKDYSQILLESLRTTIDNVQQMMNWQPRDPVRLVFHAFKPFRNEQIEAVRSLVGELGQYEVQYAFLHIVENHPYSVFDKANIDGVWDAQSKGKKGRLAPPRGIWLKISERESLLALTGAQEVKHIKDGLPRPVLLRLDSQSSFKDMKYLTRQVFHFASHSWRSFFPSPMPITILYSDLIANLIGNLCRLSKWDSQAMLGPIGRTRWFL